jgi:maltose alpha-D-glucosyltransferase/alpha-amylase
MSCLLTERQHVTWAAPLLGFVEYRGRDAEPTTLAVLHKFIPNQGDAWQLTLDHLSKYFERVSTLPADARQQAPPATGRLFHPVPQTREDEDLAKLIGEYLFTARQIGHCRSASRWRRSGPTRLHAEPFDACISAPFINPCAT